VAYEKSMSRAQPTAFIFAVDRSYSMDERIGGSSYGANKRKADAVADALNRVLYELTVRCGREEGVRDYFHIAVIGYGGTVGSALAGPLANRELIPISELADAPLRVEDRTQTADDGVGGTVEQTVRFPVWFEAVADGGTPMCAALDKACSLATTWTQAHPGSFPPIVLNISDGEATDGSPEPHAAAIQGIQVDDGAALVFNLHLSSSPSQPVLFPESEDSLADQFAKQLFRMSSVLPPQLSDVAATEGFRISDASRGFVFNADIASIVRFLDIGTRVEVQER
jgi:hypothetical protein